MGDVELFRADENVFRQVAIKQNTTLETLKEDVRKLKIWMKEQQHLPEIMEDTSILNFLILNKGSVEKAKSKIDMYYTIRSSIMPDFYKGTNPKNKKMQETMDLLYYVSPPQLTEELYRLTILKIKDRSHCDQIDPKYVIGLGSAKREIRLHEECICGDIIIIDLSNMTMGLVSKFFSFNLITKVLMIGEKVFSAPLKGIYLVNCTSFVNSVTGLLRRLLKPKLFERVHVLNDKDMLKEFFAKDILPKDYGGEGYSLDQLEEMFKAKLVEYQSRFDALDEMKVDEELRPERLQNDDFMGYHGNFKTLLID